MSARQLARTRATFEAAETQVGAARAAINRQDAATARAEGEIRRLTADIATRTASALLEGVSVIVSDVDSATLAGLQQTLDGSAATMTELRMRLAHRERVRDAARREYHKAARAYISDGAGKEAAAELATAWDAVRSALVRSMAAFVASEVNFIDPQRTSLPTPTTGPAGKLVTHLALSRLPSGDPLDAAPVWLREVQAGWPGKMAGVEDEVARLLDLVDEVSR